MTNTDRSELVKLADCPIGLFLSNHGELCLKTEYGSNEGRIDAYIVSSGEFFWGGVTAGPTAIAEQRNVMVRPVDHESLIRRLASSDGGVKGEPEPVAWPANLNPRTLDLVQRFALALAKKLHLAEEKYGHTDGWLRDDWEAECRDHLYQHLEKGDPRDVAAYCAFMWHHGWITYRPEPVASKRPVAFRVRQHRLSNHYELYTDEKDAQFWADDRGVDYEGLYLVADRYTAPPADAGTREALDSARLLDMEAAFLVSLASSNVPTDIAEILVRGDPTHSIPPRAAQKAIRAALTAPGATTKSDGGERSCTCHPDDNPPDPCPQKFAYSECVEATKSDVEALAATTAERPGTVTSEPEPSTSDPSSTRSDVTVEDLADWLFANLRTDTEPHQDARALLDQFEIRRK